MNPPKKSKPQRRSSSSISSDDTPQGPSRHKRSGAVEAASSREQSAKRSQTHHRHPSIDEHDKHRRIKQVQAEEEDEETSSDGDEAKFDITSNAVESGEGGGGAKHESEKSPPTAVLSLCDKVLQLVDEKRLSLDDKVKFSGQLLKVLTLDNEEAYTEQETKAISSLRQYLSAAVYHTNLPLLDAIAMVKKHLERDPSAVKLHSHFPAKPSSWMTHYSRLLKARGEKPVGVSAISAKFKDEPDDPDVVAAINASVEESEAYSERLKHFMEQYGEEVLPHHVPYVNSLIRKHKAKAESNTEKGSSKGRPKKSTVAKAETAFDIYKSRVENKDRYAGLRKKERDERIQADFDKLPEDTLKNLESVANM